ncbi:MAG: hypothetical protein HRT53_10475 [Colwellia sp.]|nr:hypothetical protein [Colwellia sp.]
MFSKKVINPYDFLSHPLTPQTIRNRIGVVRSHFLSAENLHHEDRLELTRQIAQAPNGSIKEQLELELHFYDHFFDRINRISSLLILYSLLENLMAQICKNKGEKHNVLVDIEAYGILRFKAYLINEFGLNFSSPEIEKHWAKISTLNKLRNSLVHSEGDLEQYGKYSRAQCKKLKNTINSTTGLSLYFNTVMISKCYVMNNINAIEEFLLAIN